jgi:acyl carrier protein
VAIDIGMSDEVLTKVQEVFGELFGIEPCAVSLQTKAIDIPEWDSVGHLSLCGALEEAFEIQLAVNDMAEMNSVRAIVFIIKEKKGLLGQMLQ